MVTCCRVILLRQRIFQLAGRRFPLPLQAGMAALRSATAAHSRFWPKADFDTDTLNVRY
jgi:hypothetical protein